MGNRGWERKGEKGEFSGREGGRKVETDNLSGR